MSIAISEIQLYNILKSKLGEKETEELVTFVKVSVENEVKIKAETLATHSDISKLEAKIAETKVDIIKWMVSLVFALALMIIGLYIKK